MNFTCSDRVIFSTFYKYLTGFSVKWCEVVQSGAKWCEHPVGCNFHLWSDARLVAKPPTGRTEAEDCLPFYLSTFLPPVSLAGQGA